VTEEAGERWQALNSIDETPAEDLNVMANPNESRFDTLRRVVRSLDIYGSKIEISSDRASYSKGQMRKGILSISGLLSALTLFCFALGLIGKFGEYAADLRQYAFVVDMDDPLPHHVGRRLLQGMPNPTSGNEPMANASQPPMMNSTGDH